MGINQQQLIAQFPILKQQINKYPLVYFDNAATTQKPQMVIDRISSYYTSFNSNIHRGVHKLSQKATAAYEQTRIHVKDFINASSSKEIIFTKGTTDSINLLAFSFGETFIKEGDEIIVTELEHHSNIVPWQMLCERKKAKLHVIPVNDKGELLLDKYADLLNKRTRLVAIAHVSNALGTLNPVKEIIDLAHQNKSLVLIDGAQAVAHLKVDVQELDCDFYAFSSHKMYGPMGIGVLYGKKDLLEQLQPYQGGGEMIESVSFEKTTYNELPFKFEAGTPNVADVLGLEASIEFIQKEGIENLAAIENEVLNYATAEFQKIDRIQIVGTAQNKASVLSFLIDGIHPYDVGTILNQFGIAVRTGNHCAEPIMKRLGIRGTIRASFACYNTKEEIDRMVRAIHKTIEMFG
ncbi:MAG: cysteine desulfurase [Bacteroidales bacterium]|jgi:cysteine desulfurase/selenocysteine lyase|nr:cysteine desulfurase [Bacteroidales bacterium]